MAPLERQHHTLLQGLQAVMGDANFTDIQVSLVDGQVSTVRSLLAAISPVFHAMLSTDMVEGNSHHVRLPTVSLEAWECITSFYFSTRKHISLELLGDLVEISEMYQLLDLKNHCEKVLPSFVTVDNCLFLNRVAGKFMMPRALRRLKHFLAENFMAVAEQEEILALSEDELLELLTNPSLVATEDVVCRTVLSWVASNTPVPDTLHRLLGEVRVEQLSHDYTVNWLRSEISSCSHYSSALMDFFGREFFQKKRVLPSQLKSTPIPSRRGLTGFFESLVILGHDESNAFVHAYSRDANTWKVLTSPGAQVHDGFASVQVHDALVVTGGETRSRTTFLFEIKSHVWSQGPDLASGRQDHGMTAIGDVAYVVGGFTVEALASIEQFDLNKRDSWQSTGSLLVATDECGVGAVGEKIVVVGGRDATCKDLIQTFNVETNTACIMKQHLPASMLHVRAASLGDMACFLSSFGDLIVVQDSEDDSDDVQVVKQVQMHIFGERRRFGLSFDGYSVGVFGGLLDAVSTPSVEVFGLDGQRHPIPGLMRLPLELHVYGVFTIPLTLEQLNTPVRSHDQD